MLPLISSNICKGDDILQYVFHNYFVKQNKSCSVGFLDTDNVKSMSNIHYHPYYEMYFLLEGSRKIFLHNKIIILKPGDVLIIKPNELHKAVAHYFEHYRRYVMYVSERFIKNLLKHKPILQDAFNTNIIRPEPEAFNEIISTIKLIEQENLIEDKFSDVLVRNYIEKIIIVLNRSEQILQSEGLHEKTDIRLQEAFSYISKNFTKKITIQDCADYIHMSKSNFTKIFNETMGINFKTYINSLRIDMACRLLENTDDSILDISYNVGFEDASYFSKVFKEIKGCSPKEYRAKNTV